MGQSQEKPSRNTQGIISHYIVEQHGNSCCIKPQNICNSASEYRKLFRCILLCMMHFPRKYNLGATEFDNLQQYVAFI